MLERWVRLVLRHRIAVVALWLAATAAGLVAAGRLPGVLGDSFAVPGTPSQRALAILDGAYGERPEGAFTVVFPLRQRVGPAGRERLQRRLEAAARAIPGGRAGELRPGGGLLYGDVETGLPLERAKALTPALRDALRRGSGPPALVTGQPAIQHDLDPVLRSDLRRGEALALPVALLALLAVLGLSWAVAVPFAVAAATVSTTLGLVYVLARELEMVTWVTNLVVFVGIGLAVDYSLLVVQRFREEAAGAGSVEDAVVRTAATAGRATVVSGGAVAIGLGLLAAVPVPFIRSMGIAGFLVPAVAVAASLTLQPVLLALLGRRGAGRPPRRRAGVGAWERIARFVVRRRVPVLVGGVAVLLAAAAPAALLEVTPGSISQLPSSLESVRGYDLVRGRVGAGAATPTHVVVDAGAPGAARAPAVRAAAERLAGRLFHDPEVLLVASGPGRPYVDPSGRYTRVVVVARHEYGDPEARRFVHRLRDRLVPAARFPAGTAVVAGGAPPQGVDFLARSYAAFPWLVVAVLLLTFAVLLRAFRSLVLPLKAVALNLLTVAAVYGLLVVACRWDAAASLLGLDATGQVEGWIPIFVFAVLFGLSMDYEVFLVMRIREAWDDLGDTEAAVACGLERTGRVITAAAVVMAAAFAGFVTGHVGGLQQLGVALVLAVILEATIVRTLVAPALVAVLDRWNWWLPARVARLAGVAPSPREAGEGHAHPSPDRTATGRW